LLGVLGDAEERVSAAVVTFAFLFAVLAAAVAAFLVGLQVGQRHARLLVGGSLLIAVASFVLYVVATNVSRTSSDLAQLRSAAGFVVMGTWLGLSAASGAFGPALSKSLGIRVALSVVALLAAIPIGGTLIFWLACGLAGECL